ncbi:MAG: response regulator [Bdellovibrionota bacterium]|nr:response regulator [Bdellovibrionota bacterium]MEC8625110.1 response regulator [Bdellovibrionota bacterium]
MADKDNDRAIIIDDEESVCETLELFLSNMGFFEEIVICQDGNEALKKLSNHDYSIVLLDLNMPGIDGFEVINKLKEEHKTDETFVQRIIIVSGGLGIDNIEKAKSLGVKHFLAKPFDQKEFRGKVQKIYTILKARMS